MCGPEPPAKEINVRRTPRSRPQVAGNRFEPAIRNLRHNRLDHARCQLLPGKGARLLHLRGPWQQHMLVNLLEGGLSLGLHACPVMMKKEGRTVVDRIELA